MVKMINFMLHVFFYIYICIFYHNVKHKEARKKKVILLLEGWGMESMENKPNPSP